MFRTILNYRSLSGFRIGPYSNIFPNRGYFYINMGSSSENETYTDINIRAMNCEINPLTRSDGSAMLAQGDTVVLAAAYGPVEVKTQNSQVENAYLDVCYRPKAGLPTIADRGRENVIKRISQTAILTALHPRTSIVIVVQELENRSGLEACAVNAACLALLNGGIAMKFTVAAVHCILKENDELIVDPDSKECNDALAHFTFVFDSLKKDVIAVNTQGNFNMAQYNDALTVSKAASSEIFKFYRDILSKRPV